MRETAVREPFDPALKVGEMVQNFAHDRGLYLRAIGDRMSFMPPLIINEEEIDTWPPSVSGARWMMPWRL